jgi:hypothetical protein
MEAVFVSETFASIYQRTRCEKTKLQTESRTLITPLYDKTKLNVELRVGWHTSAVFCCETGLPACRPAVTSIVTCHATRYRLPALVRHRGDYCRRLKHRLPALHFGPSVNARTVSAHLRMKKPQILKGYDYMALIRTRWLITKLNRVCFVIWRQFFHTSA